MTGEPITRVVLADGSTRYRVVLDAGTDPATGRRRQRRSTHRTLRAARGWLAETRTAAARGTYSDRHRVTLGEHVEGWLAGRLNLRASTRRGYSDGLAPYVETLGGVPLQALSRQHVEGVRDRLLSGELRRVGRPGAPLAPRTVRLGLGLLQQALDAAERDGLVPRNVARHVERPGGPGKPGAAWSLEQAQAFRAVAAADRLTAAWTLSLLGMRRGEVLGLRWGDLDLDAATVTIASTRVYVAGQVLESTPKTARGARTLPLPAATVEALWALRVRQAAERLAAGPAYAATGLVVVDEVGAPLRPERYSDLFGRLAGAAGVPVIRLHDARHTSVTVMRAAGVPDAVVAAWHGHSEAIMRSVYSHVSVEDMRRHAERL